MSQNGLQPLVHLRVGGRPFSWGEGITAAVAVSGAKAALSVGADVYLIDLATGQVDGLRDAAAAATPPTDAALTPTYSVVAASSDLVAWTNGDGTGTSDAPVYVDNPGHSTLSRVDVASNLGMMQVAGRHVAWLSLTNGVQTTSWP